MASLGRALARGLIALSAAGCGIAEPEPAPPPDHATAQPQELTKPAAPPPTVVETPPGQTPSVQAPALVAEGEGEGEDAADAADDDVVPWDPGFDPDSEESKAASETDFKADSKPDSKSKSDSKPDAKQPPRRRLTAAESALIGEHVFGVQFIWDHYGTATVTQGDDGALWIQGEQRHNGDYVTVAGRLRVIDSKTLEVEGTIDTQIAGCCGQQTQKAAFRLRRSGKRKYWRLQEPHRGRFCDKYTCHYYIDLFEGATAT